jgi:hypothetical protein
MRRSITFQYRVRRLAGDRRGNVTIEAAILLPVILVMLVLAADVVRYLDTTARMQRVAATTADLVARSETVTDHTDFEHPLANNDLATFLRVANEIAHPDDLAARGRVWVSAVKPGSGGGFDLRWQATSSSYGLVADSRLAALPPLPANGNVVVAEVIFDYEPLIMDTLGLERFTSKIYQRAFYRPRLSALDELEAVGEN